MKLIYAVKDLAVQAFGQPFFLNSKGEATRSFGDEVNSKDPNSAIAKHPEDYELYEIATWDPQTGKIEPKEAPELVIRAKDLIIQQH